MSPLPEGQVVPPGRRPYDAHYMRLALRLGRRNLGNTGPNPAVGCVIVDESVSPPRIIATGWTERGGRPHAERVALARAGEAARGATAYVTLEPCAHYGRTPPCALGLVEAGIARVVTTFDDPDPRVSGRGHTMLREAGIEVVTGVEAESARRDMIGFLTRMERKRPYVTLKLAISADGMISEKPGVATAITGPMARARSHLMRAESDAILVGHTTVIIDDPELTCRLPGLIDQTPVRVVLASRGLLPEHSRLVRSASVLPVWVLAAGQPASAATEAMKEAGVRVIECESKDGRVDLSSAMVELAQRGIGRVLVEGGAVVASAFLKADLVDEIALFRSRITVGPDGVRALAEGSLDELLSSPDFVAMADEVFGDDRLTLYIRQRD